MLSDLGYRVLKAKDAQSALAIVESGVPIDLLFTDVVMPGPLRSTELARKARERLPAIAVLFTSGYTDNAIVHSGRLDEGIELLSKPYTHEAMARKVRHVLQSQNPQGEQLAALDAGKLAIEPPVMPEGADTFAASTRMQILLVEDDELIRVSTAELLRSFDVDVLEAEGEHDARQMLADHTDQRPAHRCRTGGQIGCRSGDGVLRQSSRLARDFPHGLRFIADAGAAQSSAARNPAAQTF